MNEFVRELLLTMISWQVGIDTDFKVSIGKAVTSRDGTAQNVCNN